MHMSEFYNPVAHNQYVGINISIWMLDCAWARGLEPSVDYVRLFLQVNTLQSMK